MPRARPTTGSAQPAVEAARLCAAADGGQILVTEAVHLLTAAPDAPAMSPLGPIELKGLPENGDGVERRVGAPAARRRARRPCRRACETPASPASWAAWPSASSSPRPGRPPRGGERRLVLVCGEPGIGKTRLAAELAHEARDGGATVLYGRCDDEAGVPYQPWREALGHLVDVGPTACSATT